MGDNKCSAGEGNTQTNRVNEEQMETLATVLHELREGQAKLGGRVPTENQDALKPNSRVAQDKHNQEESIQLCGEQSLGMRS